VSPTGSGNERQPRGIGSPTVADAARARGSRSDHPPGLRSVRIARGRQRHRGPVHLVRGVRARSILGRRDALPARFADLRGDRARGPNRDAQGSGFPRRVSLRRVGVRRCVRVRLLGVAACLRRSRGHPARDRSRAHVRVRARASAGTFQVGWAGGRDPRDRRDGGDLPRGGRRRGSDQLAAGSPRGRRLLRRDRHRGEGVPGGASGGDVRDRTGGGWSDAARVERDLRRGPRRSRAHQDVARAGLPRDPRLGRGLHPVRLRAAPLDGQRGVVRGRVDPAGGDRPGVVAAGRTHHVGVRRRLGPGVDRRLRRRAPPAGRKQVPEAVRVPSER
jgi:hypothetical protein